VGDQVVEQALPPLDLPPGLSLPGDVACSQQSLSTVEEVIAHVTEPPPAEAVAATAVSKQVSSIVKDVAPHATKPSHTTAEAVAPTAESEGSSELSTQFGSQPLSDCADRLVVEDFEEPEAEDTDATAVNGQVVSLGNMKRRSKKQPQKQQQTLQSESRVSRLCRAVGLSNFFRLSSTFEEDRDELSVALEETSRDIGIGQQKNPKQKLQKPPKQKVPKSSVQQQQQWEVLASWMARIQNNGPFLFACVCMLAVVLFEKLPHGANNTEAKDDPCWKGANIPSVINTSLGPNELPFVKFVLPAITLHAPCLLDNYARIVMKYTHSASAWYYVKTHDLMPSKIELRNRHEEPIVMHQGLEKHDAMVDWLAENCLPRVGIVSDFALDFYIGREQGLIIALFEQDLEVEAEIDKAHRGWLAEVAEVFKSNFYVTYMPTKKNLLWIQSEFGVTEFPAVAVMPVYPGKVYVYRGPSEAKPLVAFIKDVGRGCFDHQPGDLRRFFNAHQDFSKATCTAEYVLGPTPA
jgi:hypothetical protein